MSGDALRKPTARRLQILLRIKHPTLDPEVITRSVGIEPEETINAGASVSRGVRKVHSESYWLAELSLPTGPEIIAAVANERLSFSFDAPKLRALTANLADFTSPRLSATERAKPDPRGLDARAASDLVRSPAFLDLVLLARLLSLQPHREFFRRVRTDGGSATLLVQLPDRDAPITITPALARRLADLDVEMEID
jgi:hypothetical protein